MTKLGRVLAAMAGTMVWMGGQMARAQAIPTATATVRITAWGGMTGNFTGLELAKNLSFTGGGDFEFRPHFTLYPSLEVRGMLPILTGQLDSQKNLLGGLRLGRHVGRFAPYGDVLFGRGEIEYLNGGYPNPQRTLLYTRTPGNVLSVGGGVDVQVSEHWAGKGDFQLQRYATPVTESGHLASKVFTAGVVYRFTFGGRHRRAR